MKEHPEDAPLFAGLAGASLGVDRFEVVKGLEIRRTYAHVMAPYILSFKRPYNPGQLHPGPYKSAGGGTSWDIQMEVVLDFDARPTGFDRLNTLWWTLALLRLYTCAGLWMPVMSNMSFGTAATSSEKPNFWPVETQSRQLATDLKPPDVISKEHLNWLRGAFSQGAKMMEDQTFNLAFQTLDSVIWAHSSGSAIVMIWAALETLIAPGQMNITKKMASSLAALLEPPGEKRERMFQLIVELYKARGSSAHAGQSPEVEQLLSSFNVARRTFVTCINRDKIPDCDKLQDAWRRKY